MMKGFRLGTEKSEALILVLLQTCCVTLGKSFNISESHFFPAIKSEAWIY